MESSIKAFEEQAKDVDATLKDAKKAADAGNTAEAKKGVDMADADVEKITKGVMEILDRPENDSFTKNAVREAKSVLLWNN